MNRRGFLGTLFGGAAALVTAPTLGAKECTVLPQEKVCGWIGIKNAHGVTRYIPVWE